METTHHSDDGVPAFHVYFFTVWHPQSRGPIAHLFLTKRKEYIVLSSTLLESALVESDIGGRHLTKSEG